jgi:uncharacterized membrane protein
MTKKIKRDSSLQSPLMGKPLQVNAQAISFSGPLPPPELLRKYDDLHPGLAERIIVMAEKEAEHKKMIDAIIGGATVVGLAAAFVVGRRQTQE